MKNKKILTWILAGLTTINTLTSCTTQIPEESNLSKSSITEEESNIYQIILKDENGAEISRATILKMAILKEPDTPQKIGYEFLGWYNGDEKYDFNSPVNSDITLTAKWEKILEESPALKNYTVSFKSLIGDIPETTVLESNTVAEPSIPAREGYEFLGWYNGNEKYDFNSPVNSDIILTAKWKCPKFKNILEFKENVEALLEENNSLLWISIITDSQTLYFNTHNTLDFSLVESLIEENKHLFKEIIIEFTGIQTSEIDYISSLPKGYRYTYGLDDNFEEHSLKEIFKKYNVKAGALYNGNISLEDLEYLLSLDDLDFHIYSDDFDKFDYLNAFCPNPKNGFFTVCLNKYSANKRITLPNYNTTRIYIFPESINTEVTFVNKDIIIDGLNCENLSKVRCLNESEVLIYSSGHSYFEVFGQEPLETTHIMQELRNVSLVTVSLTDGTITRTLNEYGEEEYDSNYEIGEEKNTLRKTQE